MITNLSFGEALEAVQQGKLISREGWNGKGMFVFQIRGRIENIGVLLGNWSLPKGVKDYFEGKNQPIANFSDVEINFTPFLCMKAADDSIVTGWLASQSDMLSNDWCVCEASELY